MPKKKLPHKSQIQFCRRVKKYADPTNSFEKKVQIINGKEEPIKIIDVLFPEGIEGAYDVADKMVWKKDITFKMKFPIIEKSVGKFVVTITVNDKSSKIHKLKIPCIYIGVPNMKN